MFLMLWSNLHNHTFIIFQGTQFYWHSFLSHSSIYYSSSLSCVVCWSVFSLGKHGGAHVYSACRPPPARNLACSGSENERQTVAHSSVHILRCWWHRSGQLERKRKGKKLRTKWHYKKSATLKCRNRNRGSHIEWENQASSQKKLSFHMSKLRFHINLPEFWFDCSITSKGVFLREVMTTELTFLHDV